MAGNSLATRIVLLSSIIITSTLITIVTLATSISTVVKFWKERGALVVTRNTTQTEKSSTSLPFRLNHTVMNESSK